MCKRLNGGGASYVSPIKRSGLEVARGTLNHDVLLVQTHQSLFRVTVPRVRNIWRAGAEVARTRYLSELSCSKPRDCACGMSVNH